MYIVLLKFSANKAAAGTYMDGHKAWLQQGFDDGLFVLAGSLVPGLGGAVVATGLSREDLDTRVAADPFVAEDVVVPEVLELDPARADDRLAFLLG